MMALEHTGYIKASVMKICSSNEYIMSKKYKEHKLRKSGEINQRLALLYQTPKSAMLRLHAKAFHTLNWKTVRYADAIATSRNEGLHHLNLFQPLWRHFVWVSRKDN